MSEIRRDYPQPAPEQLVRWLRGLAEAQVTASGSRATLISDMYFDAADAIEKAHAEIFSLSQERDRLREALTAIITENDGHWNEMGLGYAPDLPMIVNAQAALQKDTPS